MVVTVRVVYVAVFVVVVDNFVVAIFRDQMNTNNFAKYEFIRKLIFSFGINA